MTVTIAPANALPHAREIKELFLAHERPEFPDFFDRAYPAAFANGATSWLGRDRAGRLVMHIGCWPRPFRFAGRDVVAGLLVNLMVTKPYRSFFPALTLVRRLVEDSKKRGAIDFLYSDPNADSRTLLRGTRFVQVGTVRRYVLPVADPRRVFDLGLRLAHRLLRLGRGVAPPRAEGAPQPAALFHVAPFRAPHPQSPRLVPCHDHTLYTSRLAGYPGEHDWWFTTSERNGTEGALLIRGPDATGLAVLHALRRTGASDLPLATLLPGLVAELRRRRCTRLQVTTLAESALARALQRCGFMPRSEGVPLVALPLTPLGETCVRAGTAWEITDLDCDR